MILVWELQNHEGKQCNLHSLEWYSILDLKHCMSTMLVYGKSISIKPFRVLGFLHSLYFVFMVIKSQLVVSLSKALHLRNKVVKVMVSGGKASCIKDE